jgi:hypothetical protein
VTVEEKIMEQVEHLLRVAVDEENQRMEKIHNEEQDELRRSWEQRRKENLEAKRKQLEEQRQNLINKQIRESLTKESNKLEPSKVSPLDVSDANNRPLLQNQAYRGSSSTIRNLQPEPSTATIRSSSKKPLTLPRIHDIIIEPYSIAANTGVSRAANDKKIDKTGTSRKPLSIERSNESIVLPQLRQSVNMTRNDNIPMRNVPLHPQMAVTRDNTMNRNSSTITINASQKSFRRQDSGSRENNGVKDMKDNKRDHVAAGVESKDNYTSKNADKLI